MNMCVNAERPTEEYRTNSCGAGPFVEGWGKVWDYK